jgi:hypothetical protein
MLDEINKFGEINSVNDFFDFSLSIKTIILLFMAWCFGVAVIAVFMLGGVNNTIDYLTTIADEMKQKIIASKNKNTNNNTNNNKKNTDNAEKEE